MADEILKRDQNNQPVIGLVTDDTAQEIRMGRIDDLTKGLKVMIVGGAGAGTVTSITASTGITLTPNPIVSSGTIAISDTSVTPGTYSNPQLTVNQQGQVTSISNGLVGTGTVTSVSVSTANGISGTVATATTTPAITLTLGAITPSAIQVSGLTASQILSTDASKNLTSLDTATYPSLTELSYVKGVTSALQTQINAKGAGTVTAITITTANGISGSSSGGATPGLTFTLGAINPTTVDGLTISSTTGTFTLTNAKTLTVQNSLTFSGTDNEALVLTKGLTVTTNAGTLAFGSAASTQTFQASDTIVGRATTDILTNKTIIASSNVIEEITSIASSATPTPTGGSLRNAFSITALATAATFAAPSGSPSNWNRLLIRIKDNGTARALTWDSIYVAGGVALPTTTILSKILTLGFIYNTDNSLNKWMLVANSQES